MSLRPDETELVGLWKMIEGRMVEDETSKRIRTLIKEELKLIAASPDGWEKLYEDPRDHRLWELTYPSSETQGGGPPNLHVADETIRRKYNLQSL
jgi:hypothetical protein